MEIFDQKQEFQTKNWKKNLFGLKKMFLQFFLADIVFGRMIIFFKSLNIFSQKNLIQKKYFGQQFLLFFIFRKFWVRKKNLSEKFWVRKKHFDGFFLVRFF